MQTEKTDIQTVEKTSLAVQSESATVLDLISRAASDPKVDMDKMERLLTMRQTMVDREAKLAFDRAMKEAQSEMAPVRANLNNTQTHSKYASYAALDAAVRPIYTKHGFSVGFNTGQSALENHVLVLGEISHDSGHTKHLQIDMPCDGKGPKGNDVMTRTHATGAATQYGQRYLLKLGFNLAVANHDDDGNAADGPVVLNSNQFKWIIDHAGIANRIRTAPTFKVLGNVRDLLASLEFIHPSTREIWAEEVKERAKELDAKLGEEMTGNKPKAEPVQQAPDFKNILWEFGQQADGVDRATMSELRSEYEPLLEGAPDDIWETFNAISGAH